MDMLNVAYVMSTAGCRKKSALKLITYLHPDTGKDLILLGASVDKRIETAAAVPESWRRRSQAKSRFITAFAW